MTFGIPYAYATPVGVICPICLEEIEEDRDGFGESLTNHYASHYAAEHPGAQPTKGSWAEMKRVAKEHKPPRTR